MSQGERLKRFRLFFRALSKVGGGVGRGMYVYSDLRYVCILGHRPPPPPTDISPFLIFFTMLNLSCFSVKKRGEIGVFLLRGNRRIFIKGRQAYFTKGKTVYFARGKQAYLTKRNQPYLAVGNQSARLRGTSRYLPYKALYVFPCICKAAFTLLQTCYTF